ncbi:MAG: hypothetical protein KGD73_14045 [Candidatus Lokiarchaeota archaeon]|nr:hypothetical protein [Candidatus Lokiarchaeota archaeon]
MDNKELAKLLVIIGGIIGVIEGISGIFSFGFFLLLGIFSGIIGLIVAILVLLSVFKGQPIPYEPIYLIIFGVVMILFSSLIGGLLVLIGGIIIQIN